MFVPQYRKCLLFYKQFINDIIGIWIPHPGSNQNALEWSHFQKTMNSFPGLTWEFSTLSKTVDFMDMTTKISSTNNLHITLFLKRPSTYIFTSLPIPLTCLGSYKELSTAHSSEFLPYVPANTTKSHGQRFFQVSTCQWLQRKPN